MVAVDAGASRWLARAERKSSRNSWALRKIVAVCLGDLAPARIRPSAAGHARTGTRRAGRVTAAHPGQPPPAAIRHSRRSGGVLPDLTAARGVERGCCRSRAEGQPDQPVGPQHGQRRPVRQVRAAGRRPGPPPSPASPARRLGGAAAGQGREAAAVVTQALTLAEIAALPAVTDLVTAGRALGSAAPRPTSWPAPGSSPARSSGPAAPGWSPPPGCSPFSACPSPARPRPGDAARAALDRPRPATRGCTGPADSTGTPARAPGWRARPRTHRPRRTR